ncbi:F-box protein 7-like isoform X4 [Solanum tuberosum]|uniref:F-box protein 7-like isoform X4 n=1 Tax=Solanum tuberosum TaxID=4113 RepID=UPI00073A374D|nr:PREDICTED: F-box protein 7-like isoform X4 [Solanum tuberosum]
MPNFSCSSVCSIDDYIVELAVELETTAQLRDSQFIFPQRSWLDLYGINVRPVAHFGSASSKQFLDPALIHQVLHDELLFEVNLCLSKVEVHNSEPLFWGTACLKTWQVPGTLVLVILLPLVRLVSNINQCALFWKFLDW